jgi:putative inorganic carbon (HCO3(-)) transporter
MTGSGTSRTRRAAERFLSFTLAAFCFFSTFSIAGTQIALSLALAAWLALAAARKTDPPGRTPLDVPIALFLAACLLAALLSERPVASIVNLKNLLLLSIVYLFGARLTTRREVRRCLVVLLSAGAASSLYGIVIFLTGRGEGTLGRTPGPFSTAMTYGGVLLILCSLSLAVGVGTRIAGRVRLAAAGGAVLAALALFFSFTRSSWLGMLASCVVIISVTRRRWLAFLAVSLAVLFILLPGPYRARVTSMWDPTYRTNVQRLEMLRGGWGIIRDHPWVGVGTMDLADTYRRYMPPGAVFVHGHLHNIFLHVTATTGLVGLAAFLYLLVSFFRLVIGNLRRTLAPPERAVAIGTLGALTGFIVNGLFEWNFGDAEVVMLLYLLVGCNLAFSMRGGRFVEPAHSAIDG